MIKYLYLTVAVMLIITGWMLKSKFHTCPIPEVITDTLTVYEVVIDQQVKPIFIEIKDTVITFQTDTIFKDIPLYVAQMDSVYKDSLLTLKVKYISPSPLDKRSFFSIDAKVREKIITQTFIEKETVTFNADFFFEGSVRVDTSLSYSLMAGIYPVSFKYLKSYIKAGIIYHDKPIGQAELGLRIEF